MSDADAGLINSAVVGVDYAAPDTEPPPEPPVEPAPKAETSYDPGDHTVDEVQAYIAKHPDATAGILAAERAGKNRVTLVDSLEEESNE